MVFSTDFNWFTTFSLCGLNIVLHPIHPIYIYIYIYRFRHKLIKIKKIIIIITTTTHIYTTHQTNNHLNLNISYLVNTDKNFIPSTSIPSQIFFDFATFWDSSLIYSNHAINVFLTEISMRDQINAWFENIKNLM